MYGIWNYFSKETKIPMMSKETKRRWYWEIPSYRRFSSNAAIMGE
jgi:uncharacterized protein YqgQ